MSSLPDHAHFAAGNMLAHQLSLVRSGQPIFLSGDQQCGDINCAQGLH